MKTPEHIYSPSCAQCRDEAGKDRAKVPNEDLCVWHLRAALAAERTRREEVERIVREVSEGGVEFADERVRYVAVQIDSETWAEVQRLAAASPAPQPKGDDDAR